MLRDLTSRQISEWMAFYELEPWGHDEEWRRWAELLAMIANIMRGKDQEPFEPKQFMPSWRREEAKKKAKKGQKQKTTNMDQMAALFGSFAVANNAIVEAKEKRRGRG